MRRLFRVATTSGIRLFRPTALVYRQTRATQPHVLKPQHQNFRRHQGEKSNKCAEIMLRVAIYVRRASPEDSFTNNKSIFTVSKVESQKQRLGMNHGSCPAGL